MENLVGANTTIAIRGASGKLGSLVKQSFELLSFCPVAINRETNFVFYKDPMIILDFAGPNPKNEQYWDSFSLNKVLDDYLEFLDWVKETHSFYVRVGSYGEFNADLTKYEYVASEISSTVNKFICDQGVNGLVLFPANIYGRKSLGNFVEKAIESSIRQEALTLVSQNRSVNFIYFQDLFQFLIELVGKIKSGEGICSNLALVSESNHSIVVLKDYIANQFEDFDTSRELKQEPITASKLYDKYSKSVNLKILPNRLKSYIDSTLINGLEFDSHVL